MDKKRLGINFQLDFSQVKPLNKTFEYGVCAIAYAGLNRNKSNISKEAFEKALPTLKNVPLVANYDIETDTLGGHDLKIVTNAEGEMQLINATSPFGLVPESAKQWWEDVDGTEYLMTEVLLWKRSPATQHILTQGKVAQSMEINLYDELGNYQIEADGSCTINNFEFEALCAIGVEPCFEDASVQIGTEKALSSYSEQFSLMLSDFKQFSMEKGGLENLTDLTVENAVEEVVEETVSEFSDNIEVEAENPTPEEVATPEEFEQEEASASDDEVQTVDCEFASTYETIRRAIVAALPERTVFDTDGNCTYRISYYLRDFDNKFAYVAEELYENGDWGSTDFRWAYSFDESDNGVQLGEKEEVFVRYLTSAEIAKLDTINATLEAVQADFEAYKAEYSVPNAEVNELREFKSGIEKEIYKQAIADVFADFEDLKDVPEFVALVESSQVEDFAMTAEELEEKCFALRGRYVAKFSKQTKPNNKNITLPINGISSRSGENPYGNIF